MTLSSFLILKYLHDIFFGFITQMEKIKPSGIKIDINITTTKIHQTIESNLLWMERDHEKIIRAIEM